MMAVGEVGVLHRLEQARKFRLLRLVFDTPDPLMHVIAGKAVAFGEARQGAPAAVGEDIARTLSSQPEGHRYLLPDVCLQADRFLHG